MSKLGMPVVPESFVKKTMEEHKAGLTTLRDDDIESRAIRARVREKIEEIVISLFHGSREAAPGQQKGKLFHHRDIIPSLRASYENGLAQGGALGYLFQRFREEDNTSCTQGCTVDQCCVVAFQEATAPKELASMAWSPAGVVESRLLFHEELVERFQRFVDLEWLSKIEEPIDATPVAILEPLKVRVITKGWAAEYYRALELQKFIHGTMREHPVFRYIGMPAFDMDFLEAFGTRDDLKADEFYVSGDYKAATDNLHPELSAYAFERICFHSQIDFRGRRERLLYTPYFQLGLRALVDHQLHYDFGSYKQVWGQLMGSPVSFPILCLVNAAATCVALDLPFSRELAMRVNGDDIAFIANPASYQTWKYVTEACGLKFSVGKNYTSRDFLIVNSELRRPPVKGSLEERELVSFSWRCYHDTVYPCVPAGECHCEKELHRDVKQLKVPAPWKLEGFVNQSLLRGYIKKGVDAGKPMDLYWTDLSSLQQECLRGFKKETRDRLNHRFLKQYQNVIKEMPCLCNKFYAKALGGAGLERPITWTEEPSSCDEAQRRLAAVLSCNDLHRLSRPAPGRVLIGRFARLFKTARLVSDIDAPPILRSRPRVRVDGTRLRGGGPFLGELLLQDRLEEEDPDAPFGGEASANVQPQSALHIRHLRDINRAYSRWAGKFHTSKLEPMTRESIETFVEHKELYSLSQIIEARPSTRSMDC